MEQRHPPRIGGAERGNPDRANFALTAALEEMKNRTALMKSVHKRDGVGPQAVSPALPGKGDHARLASSRRDRDPSLYAGVAIELFL